MAPSMSVCRCRCPSFTSAIHVRKGKSDSPMRGSYLLLRNLWRGPFLVCLVDDARSAEPESLENEVGIVGPISWSDVSFS